MTSYQVTQQPSGLYDVTVILPDGTTTTINAMEEDRKDNLLRVIQEFNQEMKRQKLIEKQYHEKATHQ